MSIEDEDRLRCGAGEDGREDRSGSGGCPPRSFCAIWPEKRVPVAGPPIGGRGSLAGRRRLRPCRLEIEDGKGLRK